MKLLATVALLSAAAAYAAQPVLLVNAPAQLPIAREPAPKPPFHFVEEDGSGTSPKVVVRDAAGTTWHVKFGPEVKPDVFGTRLVSALGYYADLMHYVQSGRIIGAKDLGRAATHIASDGAFWSAAFEYRNPSMRFLKDASWSWEKNPFTGTPEFNGLKILVMLLSNWDNKDASNWSTNTGVIERQGGTGPEQIYYVTDWGGSMGKWGNAFVHNKWNCEDFARQSDDFIKGIGDDGNVRFGFSTATHGDDFKDHIGVRDVRWLVGRMSGITAETLEKALRLSGATDHEARHFAAALQVRIRQMERVAALPLDELSSAR